MQKIPTGIKLKRTKLAGRPCLIASENPRPKRVILYLHGGGWILGLAHLKNYRSFAAHLAKSCDAQVWALDYRLAPEHKVDVAVEDCYRAYLDLLDQGHKPEDVHIMGDSAGASLCLEVLLKLRDEGKAQPKSAVAISPAAGADAQSGSYIENESIDPFFSREFVTFISETVFGGEYFSAMQEAPLNRDLRGLPRLMIMVGGREMLLDDSVLFAQKAAEAGVDVTLDRNDDAIHVYPTFVEILPEARPALERIAQFTKT